MKKFYKYPEPQEEDFRTYEEYQEAHDQWEYFEDLAEDEFIERRRGL